MGALDVERLVFLLLTVDVELVLLFGSFLAFYESSSYWLHF